MNARPLRVEIAGIDVTAYVTDVRVDYASNYEDHRTFRVDVRDLRRLIDTLHVNERLAEQELTYGEAPYAPRPRTTQYAAAQTSATELHAFTQDDDEPAARLCGECGMWPEHHNHWEPGGLNSGECVCVCQECMPDAEDLPDDADSHPTMWEEFTAAANARTRREREGGR